jgi:hypothetical protein
MIRRAPKVARFAGKPATTRLVNALRAEEITTLKQLELVLRADRFKFIKNVGAKCEVEALALVGIKGHRNIKTCAFCADEHICMPTLASLPEDA